MFGPILYWDLVRYVRRPAHFAQRAALAAGISAIVVPANLGIDFHSVGAVARASEWTANFAFTIQTLAIYLLLPAMLAGSICDERVHGRLQLLLTTPLSRRGIAAEKLLVGVGLAFLAMLTLFPFTMLTPIMGGVAPDAVLKAELAAGVETLFVAAATLLISARSVNGSEALVKSYAFLFALRYVVPLAAPLAARLARGRGASDVFWAWATAISPASADCAAWTPADGMFSGGPSFIELLLISLALSALAFAFTVRRLDVHPERKLARGRRSSAITDDALLDVDPLAWRAMHLRVYDRTGVWRRTVFALAAIFAVLVWAGASSIELSYGVAFAIVGVVFVANATLPVQWLINERKSGWFAELQLTPLSMDDVLRASIVGTTHHLRPLWRLALAASLANVIVLMFSDGPAAVAQLVVAAHLYWAAWAAYWSGVRQGFTSRGFVAAFLAIAFLSFARLLTAGFLAFITTAVLGALLVPGFFWFALVIFVIAFAIYSFVFFAARDQELRAARTALFVINKTRNFGRKGGDAAWADWVGVTRGRETERPSEILHAPLPKGLLHPQRPTSPPAVEGS